MCAGESVSTGEWGVCVCVCVCVYTLQEPGASVYVRKGAPCCVSPLLSHCDHTHNTFDSRCVGFAHLKQFCNPSWESYS